MTDDVAEPLLERLAGTDVGRGDVLRRFAAAVLRRVPRSQLEAVDPDALAGELRDAFRFVDERSPGELAIRVVNPDVSLDGWSGPGTVVQVSAEDRPFLLSTITAEIGRLGHEVVRTFHPVIGVERGADGRLGDIVPARHAEQREAFVHVELDAHLPADEHDGLVKALRDVVEDVVRATGDYPQMRAAIERRAGSLRGRAASGAASGDAEEVAALLDWLVDDNFVVLGTRAYDLRDEGAGGYAQVRAESGLGILTDESASQYAEPVPLSEADPGFRTRHDVDRLVTVARSHRISTVHQRVRMVNVWVKELDDAGHTVGEFRVIGLFTRKAYSEPSSQTPVLRRKLERVLEREDVVEDSHDERTFVSLFEAVPKEELFELDLDGLHTMLLGLLAAEAERDVRVLFRPDELTGTVSVLVAVPRDRYDAELRRDLQDLLLQRFGGTRVDVDLSFGDRPEAIVRFAVHVTDGPIPDLDLDALEAEIRSICRSWEDELTSALVASRGEAEGRNLARHIGHRFPPAYREHNPVSRALRDVELLEPLLERGDGLAIDLHAGGRVDRQLTRLKLFVCGAGVELSAILPILESLGLTVTEELPFRLEGEGPEVHIHDYGVHVGGQLVDTDRDAHRVAAAVRAAWDGHLEVDSLNRLVLRAGLTWEDVTVLRAYRRFWRQVGTAYTAEYQNDALAGHPEVARALVELFEARFDPDASAGEADAEAARERVLAACDEVERLDHDRILRTFLALVEATLRTNRYLDPRPPYLSLKFDSGAVPRTPKPVPYREIFVYSPEVEGIHLRGGPVARGGIRWSDRRDDFRTEVLGLMQAQMLKNAVIVPTGAKGGFVLKRPPSAPGEIRAEVEAQYRTFIRALLEITDNVENGEVVPPDRVRRQDGDDPYLVVAADRGTATFSDTANALALEHGFWLGDAFASGGSRGYDHKALGITARGAWVAVQRHFRELGIDVQTDPVTVVGIGDMSGDVFGNGMLRSRAIELVAAFNHRHIFLDPDPDTERAHRERARLFADPSLTWGDYDRDAISTGGGVWSRDLKSIPLTDEVRDLLRIDDEELAPPDLVRAILRAPVDLLFAGGIGTFVKASTETNDEIGDRANDEIRVDATDLRARVVGEGANLGLTQAARIQYARRGGRVNTDFIDNAGGVDISDHEVNVKILLGVARRSGRIDQVARDELLEDVTDAIVAACLRDVDQQTWTLTQEAAASPGAVEVYESLMVHLEQQGLLDREVEGLPSTEQMDERREVGAGLTRPELAVLLATAKRDLTDDVTGSDLPDQPALRAALVSYFPPLFVERFDDLLDQHRLRRELIATVVANDLVDRMGVTFVHRLARELGVGRSRIAAAWWAAREVATADRYWDATESLSRSTDLDPEFALQIEAEVDGLIESLTRAYLRAADLDDLERLVERERSAYEELERALVGGDRGAARDLDRASHLADHGLEPELAVLLSRPGDLAIAPDVASVARSVGRGPAGVAATFLDLAGALGLERLSRLLDDAEPGGRWARWQHRGLVDDLRAIHRVAAHRALAESPDTDESEAVERFLDARREPIAHATRLARQVEEDEDAPRLDAISVAMRAIRDALRSVDRRP